MKQTFQFVQNQTQNGSKMSHGNQKKRKAIKKKKCFQIENWEFMEMAEWIEKSA